MDNRLLSFKYLFSQEIKFNNIENPNGIWTILKERSSDSSKYVITSTPINKLEESNDYFGFLIFNNCFRNIPFNKLDFKYTETFYILPNINDPKWIIPSSNKYVSSTGLDMYKPYQIKGKLFKNIISLLLRLGIESRKIDKITIFTKGVPSLLEELSDYFGQRINLSFSTGTPGVLRKPTAQIISDSGKILGYMKVSDNNLVSSIIIREYNWLETLNNTNLKKSIPKPILLNNINKRVYSIQSAGPLENGPRKFGKIHRDWLKELNFISNSEQYYLQSKSWEEVNMSWGNIKERVSVNWVKRINVIIEYLKYSQINKKYVFSIAHKDFVPWNTALSASGLFVYDWEFAQNDTIPLWDFFHFTWLTNVFLEKKLKPVDYYCSFISQAHIYYSNYNENEIRDLLLIYFLELSIQYLELLLGRGGTSDDKILSYTGKQIDYVLTQCDNSLKG